MIREAGLRVNRVDEARRQEDRYDEMDGVVKRMSKLVQKGWKVQQVESDRPIEGCPVGDGGGRHADEVRAGCCYL